MRFPNISSLLEIKPSDNPFVTDSITVKLSCAAPFARLKPKKWEKLDLNNDGNTDLLVNLHYSSYIASIVLVDTGNNKFQTVQTTHSLSESCPLIRSLVKGKNTCIVTNKIVYSRNKKSRLEFDTLVYRFGAFIEYYDQPLTYKVKRLQFGVPASNGNSRVYSISLDRNGKLEYTGVKNVYKIGTYTVNLDDATRDRLFLLFDYVNFKKLKARYYQPITNATTFRLKITFTDGTSKEIEDYGGRGTRGLSYIYNCFLNIYDGTNWR